MHLYSRSKIGAGGSGSGVVVVVGVVVGSGGVVVIGVVVGSGGVVVAGVVVGSGVVGEVPGLVCAREPPQSSSASSSSGLRPVMLTARRTHCQRQHQRQLQSPDAQTLSSQQGSGLSLPDSADRRQIL